MAAGKYRRNGQENGGALLDLWLPENGILRKNYFSKTMLLNNNIAKK